MNAPIIDSILIPFEDSINAQALQHENVMVDVYTKMKPDSFKLQLQAVLTAFTRTSREFRAPAVAPGHQAPIRGPR